MISLESQGCTLPHARRPVSWHRGRPGRLLGVQFFFFREPFFVLL